MGGDEPTVTIDEVHHLLREGREAGAFAPAEAEMVAAVFGIGDRIAWELLISSHRVIFLDLAESDDDTKARMQEAGYSHYPVCDGSIDNVVGLVSTGALWQQALRGEPFDLRAAMTPPFFIPEIAPVLDAIESMRHAGTGDAIVVDEYGGMAGS